MPTRKSELITSTARNTELPSWIREALVMGEPADTTPIEPLFDHRAEPRVLWTLSCHAIRGQAVAGVRVRNVCSRGVGLLSSRELCVGESVRLTPVFLSDETPLEVRVVYCTTAIRGYQLGCVFESPTTIDGIANDQPSAGIIRMAQTVRTRSRTGPAPANSTEEPVTSPT